MFENQKILILGFARSGIDAARVLIEKGNQVIVNDFKQLNNNDITKKEELEKLGVQFVFGGHPDDLLDDSFDYLIKSPGIAIDHKYVEKAKKLGVEVINETEMAYRLIPKDKNIKIIAITGTNGKTTTTTLIYEFLKRDNRNVHLAGNIGYPLCGFLKKLKEGDIIVNEVSCQQLENLIDYHPDVAVLTNISEAHLEFMKTYDHYKEVKKRIFKNQNAKDIAIINNDNEEACSLGANISSSKKYFSSNELIDGAYINDNAIYYYGERIVCLDDIRLIGIHNYENIMAAIMAVKEFDVSNDAICEVLKEFNGVQHRLEFVREFKGRKFYNDTEATNIKCCQIALDSFKEPTILFLGGYERGQNFEELSSHIKNVKTIMAIGQCRQRVKEFGDNHNIPTYEHETLKEAMDKAWDISSEGDVLLLSPASASWDQYKQCEDRGDEFKEYVNNII